MFPSLNPTAHLRSDSEISSQSCAVRDRLVMVLGLRRDHNILKSSRFLSGVLRHCHQADNHKTSSYHTSDGELQHNSCKRRKTLLFSRACSPFPQSSNRACFYMQSRAESRPLLCLTIRRHAVERSGPLCFLL